jgi:hypothetical protein
MVARASAAPIAIVHPDVSMRRNEKTLQEV